MPEASTVLVHVLVVLVCAKAAAEVSERIRLPAVAGEIVAGVLIGPSVLGLVGHDEVLRILGELGVLLLLLDVGLHMNVRELAAVGRSAMAVAVVGVVVPFAGGYGAAAAMGLDGHAPLFLGAALTATSVGVTARVLGDLRALASVEARTVLGAAVADDVLGLVVLAVVVRVSTSGGVEVLGVLGIAALAVAFLVVATGVGTQLVPRLMALVGTRARAPGTLLAIALALTLAFAEAARLSGLAPIVGAFVAGICLAGTRHAGELRRDLLPLGHVFVPVFFLQIGIDADVAAFARPDVLGLAAVLFAVAVLGKLACAAGLLGSRADRLTVGFGMIPRGEVGLIFAAAGLRSGVLTEDTYGALLLVILLTTVVAPPLLRWRLTALRRGRGPAAASAGTPPPGGWLTADDGVVDLAATPASARLLPVAMDAARLAATHRPGDALLDWLSAHAEERVQWTPQATEAFVALLAEGNARSWRLLEATGILERALPELATSVHRRRADPSSLDPSGALRWATVDRVRALLNDPPGVTVEHPAWLLAAALTLDCADAAESPPVVVARRLVRRLDLGAKAELEIALLVGESRSLLAAAERPDGLTERVVVPLAEHVGDRERAAALYLLSLALGPLGEVERSRLRELYGLVDDVLRTMGNGVRNAVEQRRAEALRLAADDLARRRVADAPRAYLLAQDPAGVASDAALLATTARHDVAVRVDGGRVAVVAPDRPGTFWRVVTALGTEVHEADATVWPDGAALMVFTVATPPDADAVRDRIEGDAMPLVAAPVTTASVAFDDDASPWSTLARVAAPDSAGLLASLAAAFASAGADVHRVHVTTRDGVAEDVFEVTDMTGRKLSAAQREAVVAALRDGATPRGRRSHQTGTRRKHRGHRRATRVP